MSNGQLKYKNPDELVLAFNGIIDTELLTVGATQVHRQRFVLAGLNDVDLAPVSATTGLYVDVRGLPAGGIFAHGNVAHGAAYAGNPVLLGGRAASPARAAVADGQVADVWLGLRGQQVVMTSDWSGNLVDVAQPTADGLTLAGAYAPMSRAFLYGYNGASEDRLRSTVANGLVVDVSRIQGSVSWTQAAYSGWKTTPLNITTTAAQILGSPLASRRGVDFFNNGSSEIWLGENSGVNGTPGLTDGVMIEPGAHWFAELGTTADIWAVAVGATSRLLCTEFN